MEEKNKKMRKIFNKKNVIISIIIFCAIILVSMLAILNNKWQITGTTSLESLEAEQAPETVSYVVNYLEKDTNIPIRASKTSYNHNIGDSISTSSEVITIDGWTYQSIDKDILVISDTGNVINIYYVRRNDLTYKVNYIDRKTSLPISEAKVVENQTYGKEISAAQEVISIEGYTYTTSNTQSITIGTGENVINLYYDKIEGLNYTVNYIDMETYDYIRPSKTVGNQTYGTTIRAEDERVSITGYNYNSCEQEEITVKTGKNVINLYYTKRNDLTYTVNYLERNTNRILATSKVVTNQTYGKEINTLTEVIEIDGYTYANVETATLKIDTSENILNIYYTRRNDLTYTVNYLEQGTNKEIYPGKVVGNQTFEAQISTSTERIEIDGYNYSSTNTGLLTISANNANNVINIYYTKRTDLTYKVNYIDKSTGATIYNSKTVRNQTFGATVEAINEINSVVINGYNFDSVDNDEIVIGTGNNVINIYYTKVNNLTYKVNYLEKNTNKTIAETKTVTNQVFNSTVNAKNQIISIDGYNYNSCSADTITIGTGENVIDLYYTKRNDLSYTVNYLEEGTNTILSTSNTVTGQTFGAEISATSLVKTINGYNYSSSDKTTLTIGTSNNVINLYYTRVDGLRYTVNYVEFGTNNYLMPSKVVGNQTFGDTVITSTEIINIPGYTFASSDKNQITIIVGSNEINLYYKKRTDLTYKVNYLEEGTGTKIAPQKIATNQTFDSLVIATDEMINIDGYYYYNVDKTSLRITEGENVINIYYTKRTDLKYTVNYLEKNTNKSLSTPKEVTGQTFGAEIGTATEVIAIDGYTYDSVDKTTLKITTGENIINVYYNKRSDLSYTVNYLERDTNNPIRTAKTKQNQVFGTEITSSSEIINIDGYDYYECETDSIIIGTGTNVINIYYTKRQDLKYTVNYLEKDTNIPVKEAKVVENQTFGDTIQATSEIEQINGYIFSSTDKTELTITTGNNVINIYYVKRNNLTYVVNYIDKDTDEVIHEQKVVDGQTFQTEIKASNEKIDIDGYNFHSSDKATLVIDTAENEITLYYTKRNDLSYTVNYLEKGTDNVLADAKVVNKQTFKTEINAEDEVKEIDGYTYDSSDKTVLTITTKENVLNLYYVKRTDLSYTVNYLEKGTNKELKEAKVVENQAYLTEINARDHIETIYGYDWDSIDKETLTIQTSNNVINIYYTKKDAKVIVHYYEQGTENKLSEDVIIEGKVFDEYTTKAATDIPSKYILVEEPENKAGTMTEEDIVVTYYYVKKETKVIVHYYEEGTTNKLSETVTITGRVDDPYETKEATDIPLKYELSVVIGETTGLMTEEEIHVYYYYRVKDATLIIKYLEKDTNIEIATEEKKIGKVDDKYITEPKDIENYSLVGDSGNTIGTLTIEPITVTYYYLQKTSATVQYIDKISGRILDEYTKQGLVGDEFVTESKNFDNYVLVEEPENKTIIMGKEEIVLKYYYIHIAGGVIEKHIDIISGAILYNASYEGNEGDPYKIDSREFEGYDLVEDKLPTNAEGTMTISPIEVTYYYIYRTSVTVQYIDKITGNKLAEDIVINGHEKDAYTTEQKEFEGYDLVSEPSNKEGEMTKTPIVVTYYYVHQSEGVVENHIDIVSGEKLVEEIVHLGHEGDPYKTEPKEIEGYDLVNEFLPSNPEGTMTIGKIEVTYYYIKKTQVNVKHIDRATGEELVETEVITGHETDEYTTEPKEIEGYDLVEEPENKEGKMEKEPIDVIYYYARPAEVIVNYIDIDTNEELAESVTITGHQGDEYKTESQEIQYYNLTEIPENAEGTMNVEVVKGEDGEEIINNQTIVTYAYKKKEFNLTVDKTIYSITQNAQERLVGTDLGKVEVDKKEVLTVGLRITYSIKVTNTGEIAGKATLLETIPDALVMYPEYNLKWNVSGSTATLETDVIQPGETKEYHAYLDWHTGKQYLGVKENVVEIIETENEAGFVESKTDDNKDTSKVIIAISTGEETYVMIAGTTLIVLVAAAYIIVKKKRKED